MASGRIRSIKPELLEDGVTAGLSLGAFRLLVGCLLLADDHGLLRGDPEYMRGLVFWKQSNTITVEQVAGWLAELVQGRLIIPYQVAEQPYLHVRNWKRHQRVEHPGRPRCPIPPWTTLEEKPSGNRVYFHMLGDAPDTLTTCSRHAPGMLPPDQGSGTKDQGPRSKEQGAGIDHAGEGDPTRDPRGVTQVADNAPEDPEASQGSNTSGADSSSALSAVLRACPELAHLESLDLDKLAGVLASEAKRQRHSKDSAEIAHFACRRLSLEAAEGKKAERPGSLVAKIFTRLLDPAELAKEKGATPGEITSMGYDDDFEFHEANRKLMVQARSSYKNILQNKRSL